MRLDPDCVRDILLEIESKVTFDETYDYQTTQTTEGRLAAYSPEEIIYHIRQCDLNGFLSCTNWVIIDDGVSVQDLTPKGHEFLANIRSDTFFQKVKNICKELGLYALKDFENVAINCAMVLIKSYFQMH